MPVGLMARCMSSSEFVRWMAYSHVEPFGGPVDDYRAGLPAAAVYNVNRASAETPTINPLSFYGWTEEPEPEKPDTPEETARKLREFAERQEKIRKLSGN